MQPIVPANNNGIARKETGCMAKKWALVPGNVKPAMHEKMAKPLDEAG